MSVIGTNIKNVRIKKNLSTKDIAKKCGISELALIDIESGKKIPNTHIINAITKALGVNIDAIEPSYFSDYFENEPSKKEDTQKSISQITTSKQATKIESENNTLSSAFSKATRKIPVLHKITLGKRVPFEGDVADYKFEPIFQNKNNNVAGDEFIYYIASDNSMSGSRILKNDLALVFLTDNILDGDIILFTYNNKAYMRRYKSIEDKSLLLYPDNAEFNVIITPAKDINIIGKIVRVEFKI